MACATKVLLEVPADLKILNIYLYTIDALLESAHFDYNTTFLRSHKISWDLTISTEVSQDLLRYHKIYWDLKYQLIWHSAFNFDTWHLTFDIDMLLTLICCDIWQLIFDIYAEFVWLHCCFTQHSNASYSTLLHTLQIFAIFVYFALVPSHALGASTSRAATLFIVLEYPFWCIHHIF